MRKKEMKLLVAFDTTTEAMEMEARCKAQGIVGRLIPTPQSITAGCGLTWCSGLECREQIEMLLREFASDKIGIYEQMI